MVKYADSPKTETLVDIEAPPAAVWALISDINMPAQFSDEFQRAEWIDPEPAVGATFRGYNRHPKFDMEWDVVCTVTALEPERTFEWTIGALDNKVARWRFDLSPAAGGSQLRFSAEMGPGPSGLTPAIEKMPDREEEIVDRRLQHWNANMVATLEGVKAQVEAG